MIIGPRNTLGHIVSDSTRLQNGNLNNEAKTYTCDNH